MFRTFAPTTPGRCAMVGAAAAVILCLAGGPVQAQCEDLEAKVELLTRQITAMQRQIIALKAQQKAGAASTAPAKVDVSGAAKSAAVNLGSSPTKAPSAAEAQPDAGAAARQRAAAARGAGRDQAVALYDRIDELLGAGRIDEAKQALETFNTTNEGTPAVAWTRSLTRELTAVGKPTPDDWSIQHWFQGESSVKLDSGAPTVVVFWESWCPHCRDEVPKLQAIYDRYHGKGLQVVGVTRLTRTATADTVRTFIEEHNVSYPIAQENGTLAEYFSVKGIPAAAVVKNGRIVWRGHPTRLKPALLESWM